MNFQKDGGIQFQTEGKVMSGDPQAPGAQAQVWLYRRPLTWYEAGEGEKTVRAMVMQVARWVAERSVNDGQGMIVPEEDALRMKADILAGKEPSYEGSGEIQKNTEDRMNAEPGRMEKLEEKVASQDAKLDLILQLLARKQE